MAERLWYYRRAMEAKIWTLPVLENATWKQLVFNNSMTTTNKKRICKSTNASRARTKDVANDVLDREEAPNMTIQRLIPITVPTLTVNSTEVRVYKIRSLQCHRKTLFNPSCCHPAQEHILQELGQVRNHILRPSRTYKATVPEAQ